ncbi:MAG TPA: YlxR family protein [Terriglobales bacterium]|nr:YlxR family protein [Terriglobales bacterium]
MSKRGHCPQRTCLGCGAREKQSQLIRLRVGAEGVLEIDRVAGRGGYVHRDDSCWQAFLRRKSLSRAFHAEIGKDVREKIIRELKQRYGD